jgi:hypothetical protein
LNRGKPRVRLVPAGGRQRVIWDDHLATAIPNKGASATETVDRDRGAAGKVCSTWIPAHS